MDNSNEGTINQYLQPGSSPITINPLPPKQVPWKFGIQQKIQAKFLRGSGINLKRFVVLSNQAVVTGTIPAGSTITITNILSPNAPHQNDINFAIPFVSLYNGTAAIVGSELYPRLGNNTNYGTYTMYGGMDFTSFSTASPGSVNSCFNMTIHNNDANPGTVYYVSQFKYLVYNNGTVT